MFNEKLLALFKPIFLITNLKFTESPELGFEGVIVNVLRQRSCCFGVKEFCKLGVPLFKLNDVPQLF